MKGKYRGREKITTYLVSLYFPLQTADNLTNGC